MSSSLSVVQKAEIAARVREMTARLASSVMACDFRISRTEDTDVRKNVLRHPVVESDAPFGGWNHDTESMLGGVFTCGQSAACIESMQESWQELLLDLGARMAAPEVILRSTVRYVLQSSQDLLVAQVLEQLRYDCEYQVTEEDIWDVAAGIWRELKSNTPK